MESELLNAAINIGVPLFLLILGYWVGRQRETRHFESIRQREKELATLPAITFRELPTGWGCNRSGLVSGSVVVSLDYFKRFVANLRAIVGGRVKAYEPLLDRARREALLRMKEDARQEGFDAIINVRLETSRLASSFQQGKGTAGVEILAYGTGIRRTP